MRTITRPIPGVSKRKPRSSQHSRAAAIEPLYVRVVRPHALTAIVFGGLTAGVLDGLDAVIFYRWYAGVSPTRLFQGIASGLIGARSFNGGWSTTVLGIALHFSIALGAACVYYGFTRLFPLMLQKPFLAGPAFGIGVYLFMRFVVVPLSAIGSRGPVPLLDVVDQLFSHMFFVGLPIALFARWAAQDYRLAAAG